MLVFYGISTLVGYLIPNSMVCKRIFFNELELIYLHTVKWLQVFLSNTNNSIEYKYFFCTVKYF